MITSQRTDQTTPDDSPNRPTSHRLVGDAGVRVGPMTRRYEIQHPGVIDHATQVRSIAAQVGRHRAVASRRLPIVCRLAGHTYGPDGVCAACTSFAGDDTATVRIPRSVLTASAPL
ncbi:hypothetical protein TEK04_19420 [Klenkia sp. LSe6-5]|uniref:Uncharacterized protein n=1 Tax=Klenkia sesuvii TaxID=3103137 RepID=A0ABU8DYJ3_9ACTN